MPNAKAVSASAMRSEIRQQVRDLVAHCELIDVELLNVQASREGDVRPISAIEFDTNIDYHVSSGKYASRYTFDAMMQDESEDVIGRISATYVAKYSVEEGFVPSDAAAQYVAQSSGLFAVFPYMRQLVHSISSQLQLTPTVLGLLRPGDVGPQNASLVVQPHDPRISRAHDSLDES